MSRAQQPRLATLLQSFFHEHLQRSRGASRHTVRAYRDTLRLMLIFAADERGGEAAELELCDLDVDLVTRFLTHLETSRANTAATRNCRLTAVRGFFRHLLRHDPARAEQYQRVLSLPATVAAAYLEPEDVKALLSPLA